MYPTKKGSIDDATASDWNAANKPTTQTKTFNQVERPAHYNQDDSIECIDAIQAQLSHEEFIGYIRGTIAKYRISRRKGRPGLLRGAHARGSCVPG